MDSGTLGYGQSASDTATASARFIAAGHDYRDQASRAALVMATVRPTSPSPPTYTTAPANATGSGPYSLQFSQLEQGPSSFTGAMMGPSIQESSENPACYSGAQNRRYIFPDMDLEDGSTHKRP